MDRRTLLSTVFVGTLPRLTVRHANAPIMTDWLAFRERFIKDDGRVIDSGNGGISHTEGQGWGLLFAETFDDQVTFNRILHWTSGNLRRPHDALHAWRYSPNAKQPVADKNNATDGDLLIAGALARAGRRWGAPDYTATAADIGRDVLRLLTRRVNGQLVLLPGISGFETEAELTVNLSYYTFPLFPVLARLVPSPEWADLRQSGLELIEKGRFGRWTLPPDWLRISRADGSLAPAAGWPPRCSYDAIRVPLYLIWAGLPSPAIAAFATFYKPRAGAPPPAWVNLKTQAEAPYPAPAGMLAVANIAAAYVSPKTDRIELPNISDAPDYYSASLILLSKIAWQQQGAA
jgi:endo-1,4-beta-D-glucanase Y